MKKRQNTFNTLASFFFKYAVQKSYCVLLEIKKGSDGGTVWLAYPHQHAHLVGKLYTFYILDNIYVHRWICIKRKAPIVIIIIMFFSRPVGKYPWMEKKIKAIAMKSENAKEKKTQ